MAKCMHRWVDPHTGQLETVVGPFSCGRKPAHKGFHAHSGHGADALWTSDGELVYCVQQINEPSRTAAPPPDAEVDVWASWDLIAESRDA